MKSLIDHFEDGTLDLKTFDHRSHIYVAWFYLKNSVALESAVDRYIKYLKILLEKNGQLGRFNEHMTRTYIIQIAMLRTLYNTSDFDEFMLQSGDKLKK